MGNDFKICEFCRSGMLEFSDDVDTGYIHRETKLPLIIKHIVTHKCASAHQCGYQFVDPRDTTRFEKCMAIARSSGKYLKVKEVSKHVAATD